MGKRLKKICIMCAKGDSSRLPRKNCKKLLGKPIFYYALESALESDQFDHIFLSTDDNEINDLANNVSGIHVDIRPEHIRGDAFSSDQVASELIVRLGGTEEYDTICLINACSPLVQPFHLEEAMGQFLESKANTLASVSKFKIDPRYFYKLKDGLLIKNWDLKRIQSNNNEACYYGNGAFNIIWTKILIQHQTVFVDPILPYIMDEFYAFDIDTQEDFNLTERQLRFLKKFKNEIIKE